MEAAEESGASSGTPVGGWSAYADALLQRAALMCRIGRDQLPDPLAGLRIRDVDMLAALAQLPGLRVADPDALARVAGETGPAVTEAERMLLVDLTGEAEGQRDELTARRLRNVVRGARLSVVEAQLLAVLLAVELDARRQRVVAYVNDEAAARWVTPHTIAVLFGSPESISAAGPDGGLRRASLLMDAPDAAGWSTTALRPHPDLVWFVLTDVAATAAALPPESEILDIAGSGSADLVVAAGADRIRRTQAVLTQLYAAGVILSPEPRDEAGWNALIRAASLRGLGIIVEVPSGESLTALGREKLERTTHLPIGVTSSSELPLAALPRRRWVQALVAPPAASSEEVHAVLGADAVLDTGISADQLESVATAARALGGDVRAAVRRLAIGEMDTYAERIVPRYSWSDLILPEHQLELIREVVSRSRHRHQVSGIWGFDDVAGVLAMFSGPSGTGKTLAAEVLAGELGVDLYRVDLSQVVDKYVGETEKKLSAVFSAAEANPMVLFLDEADALVGRRTDVGSAHDRYANLEVAYLLQRLERHAGVVVLATNLANNVDPAFTRRIHVSVGFTAPEKAERRRIWARCLPTAVPLDDDVSIDLLAERLELTGGQIRNIAIRAAFIAADTGTAVSLSTIAAATGREMKKASRVWREETLLGP